jgi:cysteinyl-tRNA synthetase
MGLKVYNTLTRNKQEFIPADKKKVKMYVCGPTVYNFISIGNARPVIVFDMVRNYLEFTGYKVDFVMNITDIEDKIFKKANEENVPFNVITEKYINAFLEDLGNLKIDNFSALPRASEMVPEIIEIIEKIISSGFGYVSGEDVYFDVAKFKNYGKLSGRNICDMLSSEDDVYSKQNKIDFTLWKGAKPGEPSWDSPWGKGRPGWHIECSAMSLKYLDYGLDIHGGGIDLIFPHHENEIAQSEAAFGQRGDFVRYWLHNGMIEVKDEKMSKSKGLQEDWILKNLLGKYSPNVVKMYILSTHYRSPLEFSSEKLEEAKKALERISNTLRNIHFLTSQEKNGFYAGKHQESFHENEKHTGGPRIIYDALKNFKGRFRNSMDDDFNSARAIGDIFDLVRVINSVIQDQEFKASSDMLEGLKIAREIIAKYCSIFGFNFTRELQAHSTHDKNKPIILESTEVEEFIKQRDFARKKKDFKKADEIRAKLKSLGILLDDRKEGTIWKREN